MAKATVQWNAPGTSSNVTSVNVQYKLNSSANWITHINITNLAASSTEITGLLNNQLYDFRVEFLCSYGGPIQSSPYTEIFYQCPTVNLSRTFNSIEASFAHVGASISKYVIELTNSSGGVINSIPVNSPSGTVTQTFTGLSPETEYTVNVVMYAGTHPQNKICSKSIITSPPPVCSVPTGVTATITA